MKGARFTPFRGTPSWLRSGAASCRRAFTLVELLVVIGLIVLLAGVGALALAGRGGEGAALANAQNIVAGLIGTTRAQAALHQTRARLAVYAQMPTSGGDVAKYLRTLVVLREEPPDSNRYVAVSTPITLPTPVCVVPLASEVGSHLENGVSWISTNVQNGPVSTLQPLNGFSYRGTSAGNVLQFFGRQGQSGRILHLDFDSNGSVIAPVAGGATGSVLKIALATVVLRPNDRPRFNNASGVRGLFIRRSGAVSLVDTATGF